MTTACVAKASSTKLPGDLANAKRVALAKRARCRALSAREGIEVTLNCVTKSNWHEAAVRAPPRDGPLPKTAA
jgi:hypothetical protein